LYWLIKKKVVIDSIKKEKKENPIWKKVTGE
jgi:hypothetical protein